MKPDNRAPGWQIRCRKCGFTEPWGKYGIRLGAAGTTYTLGWCPRCRWIRTHAIEKVPPPEPIPPVAQSGTEENHGPDENGRLPSP